MYGPGRRQAGIGDRSWAFAKDRALGVRLTSWEDKPRVGRVCGRPNGVNKPRLPNISIRAMPAVDAVSTMIAYARRRCSNRDIAAELFTSGKTASVHVSRILAKLDAASRTEATAIAHRAGIAAEGT